MVVEHYLGVVWRKYLLSGHVFVQLYVWIHIYHLPVPLVPEKQPGLAASRVHLEVWTIVGCAYSRLPVVVAEVSGLWKKLHFSLENWPEILGFEAMGIVDIAGDLLLFAWDFHSEEDNGKPATVEYFLFSFCKQIEERIAFPVGDGGSQRLGFVFGEIEFCLFDGLLLRNELFPCQDFCLGVIALDSRMLTSSLSCLASSISPRYIRSSLVM